MISDIVNKLWKKVPDPIKEKLPDKNECLWDIGVVAVAFALNVTIAIYAGKSPSSDTEPGSEFNDLPGLSAGPPPPDPEMLERFNKVMSDIGEEIPYKTRLYEHYKETYVEKALEFFEAYRDIEGTAGVTAISQELRTQLESLESGDTNLNLALLLEKIQRYRFDQLSPEEKQDEYENSISSLKVHLASAIKEPESAQGDSVPSQIISYYCRNFLILHGLDGTKPEPSESLVSALSALANDSDADLSMSQILQGLERYEIEQLSLEERQTGFLKSLDRLESHLIELLADVDIGDHTSYSAITGYCNLLLRYHESLEGTEAVKAEFSPGLRADFESLAVSDYAEVSLDQFIRDLQAYQIGLLSLEERQAEHKHHSDLLGYRINQVIALGGTSELDRLKRAANTIHSSELLKYHESLEGTDAAMPEFSESFRSCLESLAKGEYTDDILAQARQGLELYEIEQMSLEERLAEYKSTLNILEINIVNKVCEGSMDDLDRRYITEQCSLLLACHKSLEETDAAMPELSESFRSGLESLARGEYTDAILTQVIQDLQNYKTG